MLARLKRQPPKAEETPPTPQEVRRRIRTSYPKAELWAVMSPDGRGLNASQMTDVLYGRTKPFGSQDPYWLEYGSERSLSREMVVSHKPKQWKKSNFMHV